MHQGLLLDHKHHLNRHQILPLLLFETSEEGLFNRAQLFQITSKQGSTHPTTITIGLHQLWVAIIWIDGELCCIFEEVGFGGLPIDLPFHGVVLKASKNGKDVQSSFITWINAVADDADHDLLPSGLERRMVLSTEGRQEA